MAGRDLGFCGGDCLNTGNASLPSLLAITGQMIPGASPFEAFVVPSAGHILNYVGWNFGALTARFRELRLTLAAGVHALACIHHDSKFPSQERESVVVVLAAVVPGILQIGME